MEKNLFDSLRKKLNELSPEGGLALVGTEFGKQVKFSTSFGLEDQVITHMIASAKLEIEVFHTRYRSPFKRRTMSLH